MRDQFTKACAQKEGTVA